MSLRTYRRRIRQLIATAAALVVAGAFSSTVADASARSAAYTSAAADAIPRTAVTSPSLASLTPDGAKPSDATLQREYRVALTPPATWASVSSLQYRWIGSHNAATAWHPATAQSTFTVNYSETTPDARWILDVRAVGRGSGPGLDRKLALTTPTRPVFIALGDSITSGHHRVGADKHTVCEDGAYSYASTAAADFEASLPAAWRVTTESRGYINDAVSGYSTFNMLTNLGRDGGPALDACGREPFGHSPIYKAQLTLAANAASWNQVVITGGIDDTNWAAKTGPIVGVLLARAVARANHVPFVESLCSLAMRLFNGTRPGIQGQIRWGVQHIVSRLRLSSPSVAIRWISYYDIAGTGLLPAVCEHPVASATRTLEGTIHQALGNHSDVRWVGIHMEMDGRGDRMQSPFTLASALALDNIFDMGWPHPLRPTGTAAISSQLVYPPVRTPPDIPTAALGLVDAWGGNDSGQLGDGHLLGRSTVPAPVIGLRDTVAIAGGGASGYALRLDGTVQVWGDGAPGEMGSNAPGWYVVETAIPVQVPDLDHITAIAASGSAGYALRSDGTVDAFGYGRSGQLGDGSTADSGHPVQVVGLTDVIAIAGGGETGYALRSDGTVDAWGRGTSGELGNGGNNDSDVPVPVHGLTHVISIAGGYGGGYALRSDGSVYAWGFDVHGELGDGVYASRSLDPVRVVGLTKVVAIASGFETGYALRADGTVDAWGLGTKGELGDGSATNSDIPRYVSGLSRVTAVSSDGMTAYARRSNGTVDAWGLGTDGQLGDGTTTSSKRPVQVSELSGVTAIAACGSAGYALRSP